MYLARINTCKRQTLNNMERFRINRVENLKGMDAESLYKLSGKLKGKGVNNMTAERMDVVYILLAKAHTRILEIG